MRAVFAGCLAALVLAGPASAATVAPTIPTDEFDVAPDATCSLREAVESVNTNMDTGGCVATGTYNMPGFGPDQIVLGDEEYLLTLPLPGPPNPNAAGNLHIPSGGIVEIVHTGAGHGAIDGGGVDNIVQNDGQLTVSGVTIEDGQRAGAGGGIFNAGSLTLRNVLLTDNETTLEGPGGAIESPAGSINLTNVTISGNNAQGGGGGIHASGMSGVSLTHVTISNNTADANANGSGDGGGIWNQSSVAPQLRNTIIDGNTDLSSAVQAPDCSGTLGSFENNLIGNTTGCTFAPMMGDQVGVSAGLEMLNDNGGPTFTHALPLGSLAVDVGPTATCPLGVVDDQRGYPRPFPNGGNCDVGAYELFVCPDGSALNQAGAFPGCPAVPLPPPVAMTPVTPLTQAKKKCKKGRKLVKRKCVKKKKKKKKR